MKTSRVLYAFLCLCMLVFACTYWDYLSFLLFLTCLILPFILRLQLHRTIKKVTHHFSVAPTTALREQPVELTISFTNPKILPVSKSVITYTVVNGLYEDKTENTLRIPVFSQNSQQVTATIYPLHAGNYTIEITSVTYYDFLGISRVICPLEQSFSISV